MDEQIIINRSTLEDALLGSAMSTLPGKAPLRERMASAIAFAERVMEIVDEAAKAHARSESARKAAYAKHAQAAQAQPPLTGLQQAMAPLAEPVAVPPLVQPPPAVQRHRRTKAEIAAANAALRGEKEAAMATHAANPQVVPPAQSMPIPPIPGQPGPFTQPFAPPPVVQEHPAVPQHTFGARPE